MVAYLPKLGSKFNRGVPDISMQSVEYVLWDGVVSPASSTSFAMNVRLTPSSFCYSLPILGHQIELHVQTAAVTIAMLDDFLLSRGEPPLGFLNYWLYEAGFYWDDINDIVAGRNRAATPMAFTPPLDGIQLVPRCRRLRAL